MKVFELMHHLNQLIPFEKAENWDNVGLLIGDDTEMVSGILTTLDCTEAVVDEAVAMDCNVIICHHPLIFSGIKSITNTGYQSIIKKIIKHDIQLIAMHTNLDAHPSGVSAMIADRIGLINPSILVKQQSEMLKLQVYVPNDNIDDLKDALAKAGAGQIGNYSNCFYQTQGQGQFKPGASSNPYIGTKDKITIVDELKLECIFEPNKRSDIEHALISAHPYEEPAYEILSFYTEDRFGTGIKAELESPLTINSFAAHIKSKLGLSNVRIIGNSEKLIQTVGIIGGSGFDYMKQVKSSDVDVFLTGDIKYHEAFDLMMNHLDTIDITHYAEYVMKDGLVDLLKDTFEIPIYASQINTNPFKEV